MSDPPQRWTAASVHPDTRADPDQDPRDSEGASPDGEPETLLDHRTTLLAEHPDPGERLSARGVAVRELAVHRVEEHARHCGHADLLRERIDGRAGR